MGYVQLRLKYPDVSQPALKTDSDESVKNKNKKTKKTAFLTVQIRRDLRRLVHPFRPFLPLLA
jgi:hypothetical protein